MRSFTLPCPASTSVKMLPGSTILAAPVSAAPVAIAMKSISSSLRFFGTLLKCVCPGELLALYGYALFELQVMRNASFPFSGVNKRNEPLEIFKKSRKRITESIHVMRECI